MRSTAGLPINLSAPTAWPMAASNYQPPAAAHVTQQTEQPMTDYGKIINRALLTWCGMSWVALLVIALIWR
jgi:hypothetical protein